VSRIFFFLLLGALAYIVYRVWSAQKRLHDRNAASAARHGQSETMVQCAVCGVNVPQSEAITAGGRWFCSEEHRLRG
jgi:uncharacterized protein